MTCLRIAPELSSRLYTHAHRCIQNSPTSTYLCVHACTCERCMRVCVCISTHLNQIAKTYLNSVWKEDSHLRNDCPRGRLLKRLRSAVVHTETYLQVEMGPCLLPYGLIQWGRSSDLARGPPLGRWACFKIMYFFILEFTPLVQSL